MSFTSPFKTKTATPLQMMENDRYLNGDNSILAITKGIAEITYACLPVLHYLQNRSETALWPEILCVLLALAT